MKILINILLLIAAFTFATAQADDNVFRAQFTTQVKDKEPIDNLTSLENVFTSVAFFTDIRNCVNCKVEHVWYLNGNHVYTLKGKAKYPRYRWWSRKTLQHTMLGTWTVKVKINGQVRVSRDLEYFEPTRQHIQQSTTNKRLMINELEQCEKDLQEISKKYEAEPNSLYYKFKFDKLKKRCYGE